MTDTAPQTALASVIFVRIPDFARKAVIEQATLKDALHGLIADAVAPLAPRQRIVLDATEGAAIVVPGFMGIALGTARRVQQAAADTPFCVGVDHGPLQVREEAHGVQSLVGDGLAAAAMVSEFAQPGKLLASRAFREALAAVLPESVDELRKAGDFTDSRVRSHELFALDPKADARRRRRWLAAALAGVVVICSIGVGARYARLEYEASKRPATLVFNVKPDGQLLIDGEEVGFTPPLNELRVNAGPHEIEVRNGKLPPLKLQVNLAPGERLAVTHTFVLPPPKPKPAAKPRPRPSQPEPTFWERLRRTFGFS
jgi:hypothetical protein